MRTPADRSRIRALAVELGRVARTPVRIYLTGGSTAVLEGWREATVDVDLRFEPEADELLRVISALKDSLGVNVELARVAARFHPRASRLAGAQPPRGCRARRR